jgi:hypothetical protein
MTREQVYVDHSVRQLLAQRLYGLALGYEDLNDHGLLRLDPLLAAACDKRDPLGEDRFNPAHRGVALAGASTLNRLELSNNKTSRAHKLAHKPEPMEACLLQMGVRCRPKYAEEIVVDLRYGKVTLQHGEMTLRHGEVALRHGEVALRHGEVTPKCRKPPDFDENTGCLNAKNQNNDKDEWSKGNI